MATNWSVEKYAARGFIAFECNGERVGWVRRHFADELRSWPQCFGVDSNRVVVDPSLHTPEDRSTALALCTHALAETGIITGWRNESYTIRSRHDGTPLFSIERAAVRRFGVTGYSANLNGYVRNDNDLCLWVARRSPRKPIDPGLLDNLVGGGIASGYSAWDTLIKECGEEAGIPEGLAACARPTGSLCSLHEVPEGLHSEIVYVYDLALSRAFVPTNRDGEVASFCLASIPDILVWLARGEFTFEASLVVRDFIRRYGLAVSSDSPRSG